MAKKLKTKAVPFANTATEVNPGHWEWQLAGMTWFWTGTRGLNTGFKGDGVLHTLVYCEKVEHAAMFAEGYLMGTKYAK